MEVISVRIDTGDRKFDLRLGRRLTELYEGFRISFGEPEDNTEADIVIDENMDVSLLPISKLLSYLSDKLWKPRERRSTGLKMALKSIISSVPHREEADYLRWLLSLQGILP